MVSSLGDSCSLALISSYASVTRQYDHRFQDEAEGTACIWDCSDDNQSRAADDSSARWDPSRGLFSCLRVRL